MSPSIATTKVRILLKGRCVCCSTAPKLSQAETMMNNAEAGSGTRPPRPVALRVVAENIPEELRRLCNWVTWRYEFRERENKWTKPPYQVDGKNARTNDSLTWASYEAVWK